MNKRRIYWVCQIGGWSLYGLLQIFLYATANQNSPDIYHIIGELLLVLFYLWSTHLLRFIVINRNWLNLSFVQLIPRLFSLIFVLSALNFIFLLGYSSLIDELNSQDFAPFTIFFNVLFTMFIYFIWTIFYFIFHYFERYNKSLKYEAAAKEIELRNLRSQLNPHFIFNALNSIRALVDENPIKSKSAITQLSNILRNSLTVDRQRLVTFAEELEMVKDYLELETIRYEERLKTKFDIDENSLDYLIPPLMIQTLVENGIKHGVSTLRNGGVIEIISRVDNERLLIQVRNAGQYETGKTDMKSGFGLNNTRKRLELIYGDQASFQIFNENKKTVLTEVVLPKTL
ncbi:sensor histidine kinase [Marinoscillum sp.]|uniref:sensor histidine kinase n=1 Tax=Marinoscillum sp. TaxID=2024838 RepID=UPI003BAB10DB